MAIGFTQPLRWTREELLSGRNKAEALFVEERREEGPRRFAAVCADIEPVVRGALDLTNNLRNLSGETVKSDPTLFQTLRYFCGPPISEEDLWTLVGGPKFKKLPDDWADETAAVISLVLDPVRFPWVELDRDPTEIEREKAVLSTTVLLASRLIGTRRRGSASLRQEAAVGKILHDAGYDFDATRAAITVLDSLPRGHYSKERKVAEAKCDVPVRLRDGRLLAVECKVSNGPKNGWKRVVREVGGKAEIWRQVFGKQVITAVVLAGVFDLSCLEQAQRGHVMILWEHDLTPLIEFVNRAE
ncbi:XamI family restriction endonuclease [Phytohabitans suffuscus]|uniref:Type II restriction endonuclease n=1 Tax=Phytohabitans suffuscus TaxID=624315 RepID=A0A6F8YIF9_9ACTN|nr:XamI family restriction endonuclease [Phytohabitans suffuscus]BCB85731.1 type II restriction endonuclease [Phytohabitans suffuscus]